VRNNYPSVRHLKKSVRARIALGEQKLIPTATAKLRAEQDVIRAPLMTLRAGKNRRVRRWIRLVRNKISPVRPRKKFGRRKIRLGALDFIPASIGKARAEQNARRAQLATLRAGKIPFVRGWFFSVQNNRCLKFQFTDTRRVPDIKHQGKERLGKIMNDQEIRYHSKLQRVSVFGAAHAADFAAGSEGAKRFAEILLAVTGLDQLALQQQSSGGAARSGTSAKSIAFASLHDHAAAISHTAHILALSTPGLDQKFLMPRSGGNQALLNAARAFATDALPLKAQFIALDMPADFLDQLNADITQFETALNTQQGGSGSRIAATAGLDEKVNTALLATRILDAIIRNKYKNNPAILAEWTAANHTETAPRAAKAKVATP
jgi:hypothetical protein